MLWVLKRTVSLRRFFWVPKTYVKIDGEENINNFTLKTSVGLSMGAFIGRNAIEQWPAQLSSWPTYKP